MLGLGLSLVSIAVRQLLGGAFSPAILFGTSDQGVWYDPSDYSTLFQDSAGTTPVTALEQPVGMMLDKSKGLVLGNELVVNGDFSAGTTGWVLSSNFSVSSGRLIAAGVISGGSAYQNNVITSGKYYEVTVVCTSYTSGSWRPFFPGEPLLSTSITGVGTFTFRYRASNTGAFFPVYVASTLFAEFDNISVRELPGNHATQPTATSRPVVSARVNLLTKSEQFDDGYWSKVASSISSTNSETAPDGTKTADTWKIDESNSPHYFQVLGGEITIAGVTFTRSIRVKKINQRYIQGGFSSGAFGADAWATFDLDTGTVAVAGASGTYSIQPIENDFYELKITATSSSTSTSAGSWWSFTNNIAQRLPSFVGNNTDAFYIWGADLRVANDGVGIPAYQRVNTATDYDSTGFPVYLRADGVDDGMVTNSIDFTATDKMTVVAGVRKLSEVGAAIIELTSSSLTDGAFSVFAGDGGTPNRRFAWSTSIPQAFIGSGQLLAPSTVVDTVAFDRSGTTTNTQIFPRLNGSPATLSEVVGANTTGNFAGAPLYLFRRAGTGTAFNGRFYGMTIVNKLLSTAELTQLETYTNGKTKAFA